MKHFVAKAPLFDGLTPSVASRLIEKYSSGSLRYNEEEAVMLQGESCQQIMLIAEGLVQSRLYNDQMGRTLIVENNGAGALLGAVQLFAEDNSMPVSMIAIKPTTILIFRKETFEAMMHEEAIVMRNFMRILSSRSHFYSDKLRFHTLTTLHGRTARRILYESTLKKQGKEKGGVKASNSGRSYPSKSRVLSALEEEGGMQQIKN